MANDRDAPRPPQQLVSPMTTEIGNISVVIRKAKMPNIKTTE